MDEDLYEDLAIWLDDVFDNYGEDEDEDEGEVKTNE